MIELQSNANIALGHVNRNTESTVRKVTHILLSSLSGSVLDPAQNRIWTKRETLEDVGRSGWWSRALSPGMSTASTDLVAVLKSLQDFSRTGDMQGAGPCGATRTDASK